MSLMVMGFLLAPGRVALAQDDVELEPVIVTAPPMLVPLEVQLNTKAPQQPLPANDGAGVLKAIPGMTITRKGGSGGDPVFRGMAGSRLNILLDDENIHGGCGGRMDPPTAYIFPDSYDSVTLLKGPQTVRYGGAAAGMVRFERKPVRFDSPGATANVALTAASFDRYDSFADVKAGTSFGYAQAILTHARSGDYEDGNGSRVHSRYKRHSGNAILGWTPDKDTRLEFSAIRSDGEAAYADRGMDGTKFKRENYGLKFDKSNLGGMFHKIEAQVYYNYIDHVMDNYHMRTPPPTPSANNPDRKTTGGRFALTLLPTETLNLTLGGDWQKNVHTVRRGGPRGSANYYRDMDRAEDFRFHNTGLFAEARWQFSEANSLIGGLRGDSWRVKDSRATSSTFKESRRETLGSGFIRYERELAENAVFYAGVGQNERFPDFWEINKLGTGIGSDSVLDTLKPETTRQLDVGLTWQANNLQGFVSAFYGKHKDYILIDSRYPNGVGGLKTVARNVDATTWGGEAGLNYRFNPSLKGGASLAYVHGKNGSDGGALGQIPPLEARFTLDWERGPWSAGALWRLVSRQNRTAYGQGNIVGQDLEGETGGFGVFSLNGGYRLNKTTRFIFGIDNLFNKTYAEHLSKSGDFVITGYEPTMRVNEPGRIFWLRAQVELK
jgi:iron complex outermembrane receptor protein